MNKSEVFSSADFLRVNTDKHPAQDVEHDRHLWGPRITANLPEMWKSLELLAE